ncbi:MAG: SDR family NAD(P)-dependent oxidoreductase, partial [Thiobacillaceae bacterium]|nr:SDR family NAD(P)-dependent oxidoreductase [Thiobacillaceae bacterium]
MVFYTFGLYQGIWRFASLPDLKRILRAIALASLVAPLMSLFSAAGGQTPRTVMLLQPVLLLLIMGGSRLLYRAWKEHRLTGLSQPEAKPVLVLGAGSPADMLLRELARNPSGYRVVGLLDDNPAKIGRRLQDIPILGSLRDVGLWAQRMGVSDVILALPSVSHKVRKRLTDLCSQSGLRVLTVPSLEDLLQGRVSVSTLRPVELEDLLGRDPVVLDDAGLYQCLHDRVVLVTGAGGSIGSELCRQIARFRPARLVLYEQSEYALYSIEQELTAQYPEQSIASLIGDVKDRARVRQVLGVYRPAVVFHAAAYKHVPLMECNNALEALKNNTLGTWVLAQAALEAGVEKFVLISTDKAVNP